MAVSRKTLSREGWIKAARKVFIASGIDAVKIDQLSKTLKVTRGSFYWHFKGLEDLRNALLEDWRDRNLAEMDQLRAHWEGKKPSIIALGGIWRRSAPESPTFGMAIRVWASRSPAVGKVVQEVDHKWIRLIAEAFRADGRSELESHVRARVLYHHRVGYWAFPYEDEMEEKHDLSPVFYEVMHGQKPDAAFYEYMEKMNDEVEAKAKKS